MEFLNNNMMHTLFLFSLKNCDKNLRLLTLLIPKKNIEICPQHDFSCIGLALPVEKRFRSCIISILISL